MRITITDKREINKKRFEDSKTAKVPKKVFVSFFDNNAMARVLDMLLENKDMEVFSHDIIEKAGISKKAFFKNAALLEKYGIIKGFFLGRSKFYKWDEENEYAKLITQLRNKLM